MIVNYKIAFTITIIFLFLCSLGCTETKAPSSIEISLNVWGSFKQSIENNSYEFLLGTPIYLNVVIGNFTATGVRDNLLFSSIQTTLSIPTTLSKEERKKYVENEFLKTKRFTPTRIATQNQSWFNIIKFEIKDKHGNEVFKDYNLTQSLNTGESIQDILFESKRAYWSISPEASFKNLSEGEYKIKTVFDTRTVFDQSIQIWRGVISSSEYTIIVKKPNTPEEKAQALALTGRYYSFKNNYDKSEELAKQALSFDSTCASAVILLAEYYEKKGNFTEALANYENALKLFYQQNPNFPEPPIRIISAIKRLKQKLSQDTKVPQ